MTDELAVPRSGPRLSSFNLHGSGYAAASVACPLPAEGPSQGSVLGEAR